MLFASRLIIAFFFLSCTSTNPTATSEIVYRTPSDRSENFYLALLPSSPSKGLVVIIPGFGTTPNHVLQETKLPETAANNGYTVIIPLLLGYEKVDTSNLYQQRLQALIPELQKKYNTPAGKFIIGGHSLGGYQSMYYAEQAFRHNTDRIIKPQAVFGVDPPLDMKHLYNNSVRIINIDPAKAQGSESEFLINRLSALYGGSPEEEPTAYQMASAYSRDLPGGGNARFLQSIPVRLYCDPDINWYINERNTPIEWTNTADLSACIVELKLLGNTRAELITNLGKGYQNGQRHPHGFSMLDADEFIKWANKILANN